MLLKFSLLLALSLGAFSAVAGESAGSDDVDTWIARMGEALRTENYAGIYTYMRGQQFDTVKVVHRYEDGQEFERLVHLNGELREIIRHGDEIVCQHGAGATDDLDHGVPPGPFTHAFNENLANFQSFYDLTLLGDDRIAGRAAVKVAITPRQGDRWGYRLWLDEESGLLLQSHLLGRGKVLEVFQFTQVEIGEPIAPEMVASTLPADAPSHEMSMPRANTVAQAQVRPQWRASWVPNGFRQVASPRPNRIVFSDGIATFSVFIERKPATSRGEFGALMGGTAVISRRLKDSSEQITVVGEVPIDTAKKVAESIEPVIY